MEIDGDSEANQKPQQQLEDGEFIELLRIPVKELLPVLDELAASGHGIESRLYSLALGARMLG